MIKKDIQTLDVGGVIELFEVDASKIGGDIYRLHNGVNEHGGSVFWQGLEYMSWPVTADGFSMSSKGARPRPSLSIGNVNGFVTDILKITNNLNGAKVTRIQTLTKYLDSVNFIDGNPDADPTQELPREVWLVDRKSTESREVVSLELCMPLDVAGVGLPRRTIVTNICVWEYRGPYCGYTGKPVAQYDDTPTSDINKDVCSKSIKGCELRFGENSELPFGGFPSCSMTSM